MTSRSFWNNWLVVTDYRVSSIIFCNLYASNLSSLRTYYIYTIYMYMYICTIYEFIHKGFIPSANTVLLMKKTVSDTETAARPGEYTSSVYPPPWPSARAAAFNRRGEKRTLKYRALKTNLSQGGDELNNRPPFKSFTGHETSRRNRINVGFVSIIFVVYCFIPILPYFYH